MGHIRADGVFDVRLELLFVVREPIVCGRKVARYGPVDHRNLAGKEVGVLSLGLHEHVKLVVTC
jgi:hypothetical protein